MIKLFAQTSVTPASPSIPTPGDALTQWGVFGACVFWIIRNGWDLFVKKESREADLTEKLIDKSLTQNDELIHGYKDGVKVLDGTVRGYMTSQAAMHAAYLEEIGKLRAEIGALHRRLDEIHGTHQARG